MEAEVAVVNPEIKFSIQPKVRKYRVDYEVLRRKYSKVHSNYLDQKTRNGLIETETINDNKNLLNHKNTVMQQNAALEGAIKIGYETGTIAMDIERDLGDQNIRAVKSQMKLKSIDGMLGESDTIITRMLRREKLNKLILSGLCVLMILGVIIILYFKLFR